MGINNRIFVFSDISILFNIGTSFAWWNSVNTCHEVVIARTRRVQEKTWSLSDEKLSNAKTATETNSNEKFCSYFGYNDLKILNMFCLTDKLLKRTCLSNRNIDSTKKLEGNKIPNP